MFFEIIFLFSLTDRLILISVLLITHFSERMNDEEKFRKIVYKAQEKRIADVWNFLQGEEEREIVLIKGWAAAQNYPQPHRRDIGDIDLAINPEQYQAVVDLSKNLQVGTVDFHRGLRKLDLSDWKVLYANSRRVVCGETVIMILGFEDHLRVLIVHWLNDGGVNRKKLWDIYYAVENRPADFNWTYFFNAGDKRRRWLVCAIGLAHKYLGLNIEATPVAEEAKNLPRWVTETVEKEWKSDVEFGYLHSNLGSGKQFFEQVRKRIPPNAIQATVEMEGNFDDGTRIFYQIGDMLLRFPPSFRRLAKTLYDALKYKIKNG